MSGSEILGKKAEASLQPEQAEEEEPQQLDSSREPPSIDQPVDQEEADVEVNGKAAELWSAIDQLDYNRMRRYVDSPPEKELITCVDKGDKNNALQKLFNLIETLPSEDADLLDFAKNLFRRIVNLQPGKKALLRKNARGDTALSQAIICSKKLNSRNVHPFIELMQSLSFSERAAAMKTTRDVCSTDCNLLEGKSGHSPHCTNGFNLLMLVLMVDHHRSIDYIVEEMGKLLTTNSQELKAIILGEAYQSDDDQSLYSDIPNVVGVAAFRQNWSALTVIKTCLQNQFGRSLFAESRLMFPLQWMLQGENEEGLLELLDDSKTCELIREKLEDEDRYNIFLQLEMSVAAIKVFGQLKFFPHSYLLPRPGSWDSKLSRPQAMICYNTFDNWQEHKRPRLKDGALAMKSVLARLGFEIIGEDYAANWTFNQLIWSVKSSLTQKNSRDCASIFLLCVASHGKDDKISGMPKRQSDEFTLGEINELIDVIVENTNTTIPKVLIVEACREVKDTTHTPVVLKYANVLLLLATSFGQRGYAGEYLEALAEELKKANGVLSLEDMHGQVGGLREDCQTPQKISTAKKMILRNWNQPLSLCSSCRKKKTNTQQSCSDCYGSVCDDCYNEDWPEGLSEDYKLDIAAIPTVFFVCQVCAANRRRNRHPDS